MTTHFPSILAMLNTLTNTQQRRLLLSYTRGPNSKSYLATLEALRQRWNDMPETGCSDTDSDETLAHFRFFNGAADWYIVEKDSDLNETGQHNADGLFSFNGEEPGSGSINIQRILDEGAELDLYWEPKTPEEIAGHCLG